MIEMPSRLLVDESFDVEYVGEGAANVVFRLVTHQDRDVLPTGRSPPPSSTPSPVPESLLSSRESCQVFGARHCDTGSLRAQQARVNPDSWGISPAFDAVRTEPRRDESLPLLRLRKDLTTVISVVDAHRSCQRMILPHLNEDNVVESALASLPTELVDKCNAYLLEMEAAGIRPKKRRNCYLAYQPYANLVQDMSSRSDTDTVVEFKLKWLAQSPSAPKDSKRCRTCALRAMRKEKAPDILPDDAFCPLDLGNLDESFARIMLDKHLRRRWKPERDDQTIKRISQATSEHLLQSGLIKKVKQLQQNMDPVGILRAKIDDQFLAAMTLRDCTLFIRVDREERVEARLGDMDLKPVTKASYWRLIEQRLSEEGWYTCQENGSEGTDAVCLLSRR